VEKRHDLRPISDEDQIKNKLKETQILFRQQKYSEAKKILQDILKADPNSAAAYNNLGSIYLIRGRFTRAEKYFKKAIELDPSLADARENLATIEKLKKGKSRSEVKKEIETLEEECKNLILTKELDEAIVKYKQILELDSTNVKVYNNLGILYFQKNNHEGAEKHFVRALELYFLHGLPFDDQYTTIKDNLNKLRKKIGSNVADFMKTSFSSEIRNELSDEEEVIKTFMGNMKVLDKDKMHDVNAMITLTNKRLIVYYKSSLVHEGAAKWVDFGHNEILSVKMIKGILKNTLIITTPEKEFKLFSVNRKEMKNFLNTLKIAIGKKEDLPAEEKPSKKAPTSLIPDVSKSVAIKLLETLKDLDVLSDTEFENKIKKLKGGTIIPPMGPKSPFRKKGFMHGKKKTEE